MSCFKISLRGQIQAVYKSLRYIPLLAVGYLYEQTMFTEFRYYSALTLTQPLQRFRQFNYTL